MNKMDELDWKGYESITKYIYETLGKEFGIKIEGYGNDFKVTGISGVKHQIDVLTSSTDGKNKYQTAIECKFWKKKITKDTVMKLSKIIEDAAIDKGIIVSKSGYTRDALKFAKHSEIELVVLREKETDSGETEPGKLVLGTLILRQHITITRPEILGIFADYTDEVANKNKTIDRYDYTLQLANGNKMPLDDVATAFQNVLRDENKLFQIALKRHETEGAILINDRDKSSLKINGLVFKGILKKIESNSNTEFSLVDQVWLIMKSIFEERSFSILESGIIMENKL